MTVVASPHQTLYFPLMAADQTQTATLSPTAPITKDSRLYLIDGSGYIFRAYHALPPLTRQSDGLPVGAVSGFCNMLWKFICELKAGEKPTHLAVVFDRSEKTFRNDLYPQYKAHRPPAPEDLIPQFPLMREAARAFGLPVVEMEGFEADDLIATYARQAAKAGAHVTIVSSDKDLMQLIEDGVIHLFDPMKSKAIGPAEVMEKFGVAPNRVIDAQALIGDSTDNVPGCPGIGPKTAAELLNLYGTVEGVLEHAGEIKQPKRREALIANADLIRVSKELVTLRDDVPNADPIETFALADPDPALLVGFLESMGFRTLTRRVSEEFLREGVAAEMALTPAPRAPAEAETMDDPPIDFDAYETVDTMEKLEKWIARAYAQGYIAVDTETDALGSTSAGLVGISLAIAANVAGYIPLAHRTKEEEAAAGLFDDAPPARAPNSDMVQIPMAEALAALKLMLEDPSILKIGQNIKYDMTVFARHGIALGPYDDTMLISYVLSAGAHNQGMDELSELHLGHKPISFKDVAGSGKNQLGFHHVAIPAATRYSAEDADVTLRLWKKLKPQLARERLLSVYETLERGLPQVLMEMELAGVKIDRGALARLSIDFEQRMATYEADAHRIAGKPFNVGSPKQIGDILFGELGLPGGQKTKTGAWSTDADVLEDLAAQGHELPRTILEWRQVAKLRSTYTEALAEAADKGTDRIHTYFGLAATPTGRMSSTEPNLQNIPVRTDEGRRIREAFIAEPGHVLISADYSQIELRLLAHVADIPELKKAFADGIDIHALTASEMFGAAIEGMDPMIRRQAKAINFGIIYGISAFGLARNLGIERGEADAYIKRYFERFPGIRAYMETQKARARELGYVTTIFGRRTYTPYIKSSKPAERGYAERQAINAPLQGAAADIIRRAMVRMPGALRDAGLKARMLLQVHDELVFEAPEKEADATCELVARVMEDAPQPAVQLSVPITVEARAGKTWAAAH